MNINTIANSCADFVDKYLFCVCICTGSRTLKARIIDLLIKIEEQEEKWWSESGELEVSDEEVIEELTSEKDEEVDWVVNLEHKD